MTVNKQIIKHKKAEFEELEVLAKTSPNEMWAKLKKMSNPPSARVALDIVREDKSISTVIKEICTILGNRKALGLSTFCSAWPRLG